MSLGEYAVKKSRLGLSFTEIGSLVGLSDAKTVKEHTQRLLDLGLLTYDDLSLVLGSKAMKSLTRGVLNE